MYCKTHGLISITTLDSLELEKRLALAFFLIVPEMPTKNSDYLE